LETPLANLARALHPFQPSPLDLEYIFSWTASLNDLHGLGADLLGAVFAYTSPNPNLSSRLCAACRISGGSA
jgi:hypothetical protein